ncbi:MAG TPA: hypothetical protein VFF30_09790 [Nitrososphaerales archaeon]|nr:hypothetical protein [Nitrososphaerales archaeon]
MRSVRLRDVKSISELRAAKPDISFAFLWTREDPQLVFNVSCSPEHNENVHVSMHLCWFEYKTFTPLRLLYEVIHGIGSKQPLRLMMMDRVPMSKN